jgi:hypothetical protein
MNTEGGIRLSIRIDADLRERAEISRWDFHGKAFLECSPHETNDESRCWSSRRNMSSGWCPSCVRVFTYPSAGTLFMSHGRVSTVAAECDQHLVPRSETTWRGFRTAQYCHHRLSITSEGTLFLSLHGNSPSQRCVAVVQYRQN